jgi:hypothetical protein
MVKPVVNRSDCNHLHPVVGANAHGEGETARLYFADLDLCCRRSRGESALPSLNV